MELCSYEKMSESPSEWGLDERAARQLGRARFVVTEKLHGANLAVLCDGVGVSFAKRKARLEPGESFFGHERLAPALTRGAGKVWAALAGELPGLASLTIYGEIFGGRYPHEAVAAVEGVEPIQTGVWYSPDVHHCAFDVAWEDADGQRRYLDYEQTLEVCREAGLWVAEPLHVGGWAEALAYPLGFGSTWPARLGLPPLAAPNEAEGVVIKPLRELGWERPRPTLKRKLARFAEDARFHEAKPWREARKKEELGPGLAPLDALEWEVSSRLNANRLDATLSKLGLPRDERARAHALEALLAEVMEEVEARAPVAWAQTQAEERALLRSVGRDEAQKVWEAWALARRAVAGEAGKG